MIFTLGDAYTFCKPFIDSGTCNSTLGYARVNEAIRRLMPKVTTSRLQQLVRMVVRNTEFALPREAEKVLWVDIDGTPASAFGRPYQFLQHGPGDFASRSRYSNTPQLEDLGEASYMFSLPGLLGSYDTDQDNDAGDDDDYPLGFKLYAYSDAAADDGKELTVYGYGLLAQELRVASAGVSLPGISVPIHQFAGGVEGAITGPLSSVTGSAYRFREIAVDGGVRKPVTEGYVTLYAVYPETNEMWLVGKYHPDETIPMFRRYRIAGKPYNRTQPSCNNVLMLVKMRFVTLTRANDIVPLDSLDAIKNMCISISYENAKDLNNSLLFEQNAVRLLKDEMEQKEVTPSAPVVVDYLSQTSGRKLYRGTGLQ